MAGFVVGLSICLRSEPILYPRRNTPAIGSSNDWRWAAMSLCTWSIRRQNFHTVFEIFVGKKLLYFCQEIYTSDFYHFLSLLRLSFYLSLSISLCLYLSMYLGLSISIFHSHISISLSISPISIFILSLSVLMLW